MDDNKKNKSAQESGANTKKSDRTEFADEMSTDMKNNKNNK